MSSAGRLRGDEREGISTLSVNSLSVSLITFSSPGEPSLL